MLLHNSAEVELPKECEVTFVNDHLFTFKGPLGQQQYDVSKFNFTFTIRENDGQRVIVIDSWHGSKKKNNFLNTVASHLRNCVTGVTKGFRYVSKAVYKHFPIQMVIEDKGKTVVVKNFYGNKQAKRFPMLGDSIATIGDEKDVLIVEGTNIEHVSQSSANVTNWGKKEKLYDPRIFLDGIYLVERGEKA
ncbi:rpl6 [Ecytonucleospora hepatopenaei]|uniref:Rpl6 n=1 Tax=Ecytonucleospora hepatopenaei TaxID=646526 RepID=A0A1W0E2N4_9MICR|nr:rpl6 [Ecytonucleospora hepatopenaei]